jgi:hypothetical protein
MFEINKQKEIFRLSAVLYADYNYDINKAQIIRKIIESVLVEKENRQIAIDDIIDFCQNAYNLTFSFDEISSVINNIKFSDDFIITKATNGIEMVNLAERRYNLSVQKSKNNIDKHIVSSQYKCTDFRHKMHSIK